MVTLFKAVLSPTWFLAKKLKANKVGDERKFLLKNLNIFYLVFAIILIIPIVFFQSEWSLESGERVNSLNELLPFGYLFLWGYFLISRCNEIFIAFLDDAADKLKRTDSTSSLEFFERLKLSLHSYLELIINFAFLYMLTPTSYWCESSESICQPNLTSISDALFYSAATITTLADGSVSPSYWFVQFLTIYQIFCGFTLLIVCFTVYTGRAINEVGTAPEAGSKIGEETYTITVKPEKPNA
ncbi:ion channel [Vibrio hepatarius]|uniref:ion channel n=1 Tax=Vibrio hepatarius TaxID=171383 RepID=UPI00148C3B4F|nr:ion channel [Vibrio hepatarius]NOI16485.1 two pore domain potassium channel family protein [Vibrio hepatarius]